MTENIVGENIRTLRENRGMTQPQLAKIVGLTVQSIHRIEAGKKQARKSNLEAIAKALGCTTVNDLYKDTLAEWPPDLFREAVSILTALDELQLNRALELLRSVSNTAARESSLKKNKSV